MDLGQVLVGSVKGRKQEDEIVVFKSVGMAIEDVAVAHEVVKLAESQSVGSTLSI